MHNQQGNIICSAFLTDTLMIDMAIHMIVYTTIAIVVRVIYYPKIVCRHGSVVVCTTRLLRIVTRDLYVLSKVNCKS
jgi:hypothetical protein